MKKVSLSLMVIATALISLIGGATLLFSPGCGSSSNKGELQGSAANSESAPKIDGAPKQAVIGQIYINTTDNRKWIYDGAQWVPHDATVDAYYQKLNATRRQKMTQDEVCVDGDPSCTPTGNHGPLTSVAGHYAFDCKVCHNVGGRLAFQKNGRAFMTGSSLLPTFDATAKTCSNIACHAIPAGTFSYYFPDGNGDPVLNTVSYGGGAPHTTPTWYATGALACAACHGDPPRDPGDAGPWHSGVHGNQGLTGPYNQCQLCHPDATSPGNGIGDTITNPLLHANGTVDVQAAFKPACFNCH
jgi:hypothetical protein